MTKRQRYSSVSFIGIVLSGIAASLSFCTASHLTDGNSSETTNVAAVSGIVVDAQGSPAGNVQVTIRPAGFDPVTDGPVPASDMVTTAADGVYRFAVATNRAYTVEAVHRTRRTRALLADILVGESENPAPPCTLNAPGAIKVMVPENADTVRGFVFIPGTSIFSMVKFSRGFVLLDSVPVGLVSQILYSSTNKTVATTLRYKVTVTAGDTAVVGNPGWNYSRKIMLNTTATGANVTGNVTNFPVLIRLTAANIDFTQAKNNGEDIRFANGDTTFLSYEIERWDAIGKKAEVWVKVDTVYGNDSAQTITMYWGNPNAADESNSAAVFDTANGFAGVWHLGLTTGVIASDATANGNNGTVTSTITVTGAVGMAQMFNGASSLIQASGPATDKLNFPENGNYAVSAWVNANAVDSLFHGILYKSNFQYGLQIRPENVWDFNTFIDNTGWEGSRSAALVGSWHFLTGIRNGTRQYLYVDGSCVDSTMVLQPSELTRVYDTSFQIGHCPDGGLDPDRYFSGVIDEVRIYGVANSPDWIKLCYMNQKEQDALLKW